MQLKPIAQQVVVVFGASSGIGRITALEFAKRGAKLIVSARNLDGLTTLLAEIQDLGGEAIAVPADASIFEQVKAVADKAVEEFGRLDTWIHAAAVNLYATFEQTQPDEFKRVMDINAMGQVYGAMAALPYLKQQGGALIHISSVEARRALPYHSAYAAAKHAIDGFLEVLRVELKHEKTPVSVTNIMPASINTPLFNKARSKIGVKPQGLPPIYKPEAVAEAILYAAEHPTRELVVGGAGQAIQWMERLSPSLTDALMNRVGFQLQQTNEPKAETEPDNLDAPIAGYNTVVGDFSEQARSSLFTWLEIHPAAKWGILAALGVFIITLLPSAL
ncbi:short-chain dehydrogenase [filamentous cyanobacterium CCP1]|nr:short-chain dehydrogenase [filamentous cyanobacterium CCP2]PSB67795.1 short-chain dehydrogenase [filamentous cyanobacterium CCP1]